MKVDFFNKLIVEVVKSNIVEEKVDAIINAANSKMHHDGGVA